VAAAYPVILCSTVTNLLTRNAKYTEDQQTLIDEFYKQIGQLKVENDFLKKVTEFSNGRAKEMA